MRYGYDIGGAEWPIDPVSMSVVDILTPDSKEHGECDVFIRDLNSPTWTNELAPRPIVYLGRILRYLDKARLGEIGLELDAIVSRGGQIIIFDWMAVIEPVLQSLTDGAKLVNLDLINLRAEDREADWRAVILIGDSF
jgi:hypothetical protein